MCVRVRECFWKWKCSKETVHVNGEVIENENAEKKLCVCVCVCSPIIRRQVSGLKWDQFPLVRACCSSVAVMDPLWSASTATNQE